MISTQINQVNLSCERQRELIRAIQRDNSEEHWQAMLGQYAPAIVRQVVRNTRTPLDDRDAIESEVLLKFVQAVRSFDLDSHTKPSTYILHCLQNPICAFRLRGPINVPKRGWRTDPIAYKRATQRVVEIDSTHRQSATSSADRLGELRQAILKLPDRERNICERRLGGETMRQIARQSKKPYREIKSVFRRASYAIKQQMED